MIHNNEKTVSCKIIFMSFLPVILMGVYGTTVRHLSPQYHAAITSNLPRKYPLK
jgi:hypothetical protein